MENLSSRADPSRPNFYWCVVVRIHPVDVGMVGTQQKHCRSLATGHLGKFLIFNEDLERNTDMTPQILGFFKSTDKVKKKHLLQMIILICR